MKRKQKFFISIHILILSPPPEVVRAAPGVPLAAHHAGGGLAVGELGAALAVDGLEGVAHAGLAGFLRRYYRNRQVDRGAAVHARLQYYPWQEDSVFDGQLGGWAKWSLSIIINH